MFCASGSWLSEITYYSNCRLSTNWFSYRHSLAMTGYPWLSLAVSFYSLQLSTAGRQIAWVGTEYETSSLAFLYCCVFVVHNNGSVMACSLCHCLAMDNIAFYAVRSCHSIVACRTFAMQWLCKYIPVARQQDS
jgi:hypothetical protein